MPLLLVILYYCWAITHLLLQIKLPWIISFKLSVNNTILSYFKSACHPYVFFYRYPKCYSLSLWLCFLDNQDSFKALGDLDRIQLRRISLPAAQQTIPRANNNYPWGSVIPITPLSSIQQTPASPQHLPVNLCVQGRRSHVSVSCQRAYRWM